MAALLIGYARVSTDQQDLTAQRDGLTALGVSANPVYVDQVLTGTKGSGQVCATLAACRKATRWWSPS
jgi:DNA invertase Pin-like site-specific DNA recombinase